MSNYPKNKYQSARLEKVGSKEIVPDETSGVKFFNRSKFLKSRDATASKAVPYRNLSIGLGVILVFESAIAGAVATYGFIEIVSDGWDWADDLRAIASIIGILVTIFVSFILAAKSDDRVRATAARKSEWLKATQTSRIVASAWCLFVVLGLLGAITGTPSEAWESLTQPLTAIVTFGGLVAVLGPGWNDYVKFCEDNPMPNQAPSRAEDDQGQSR
ncbi:hypothetical protein AABM35_05820 [Micrococcus luteus]|uniref:hypothetical protein n=1 Tax=Micrococcus luteus TaxID=1270 RepID=UPI003C2F3A92